MQALLNFLAGLRNTAKDAFKVELSGSNVEGSLDAVAPTKANLVGGKYIATKPTFHDGDLVPLRANSKGEIIVQSEESWTPLVIVDSAVGNTKTFTVPANTEYRIQLIKVRITTTATVGNRMRGITISDGTINLMTASGALLPVVAASQTNVGTTLAHGGYESTSAPTDIFLRFPPLVLKAGHKIVISDTANIDVADTYDCRLLLEQRSV